MPCTSGKSRPTQVRLMTDETTNQWGFWYVSLTCECEVVLLMDPNGVDGTQHPRENPKVKNWEPYWLGSDSPTEQVFQYGACAREA